MCGSRLITSIDQSSRYEGKGIHKNAALEGVFVRAQFKNTSLVGATKMNLLFHLVVREFSFAPGIMILIVCALLCSTAGTLQH